MTDEKKLRGFAALKASRPEMFRDFCSRGGKSAHEQGRAHEYTSETGKAAGRKGGLTTAARRRAERDTLPEIDSKEQGR